jgi:hypothetical protein
MYISLHAGLVPAQLWGTFSGSESQFTLLGNASVQFDYDGAVAACELLSAKLAIISSMEEDAFVSAMAREAEAPAVWIGLRAVDVSAARWVGPNPAANRSWYWLSGACVLMFICMCACIYI